MYAASSNVVLPAPFGPISQLTPGPGANSAVSKQRRLRNRSRSIFIAAPRPGRRATTHPSQSQGHDHVLGLLTGGATQQAARLRVPQLQMHPLLIQRTQSIEQITHIEPDSDVCYRSFGLDFLERLFLFRIMGDDTQTIG